MRNDVIDKLSTLIAAAFGLVAALAWNDAIKSFIASQKWLKVGGPWLYAIAVTVIAVFVMVWVGKLADKVKKPGPKEKKS